MAANKTFRHVQITSGIGNITPRTVYLFTLPSPRPGILQRRISANWLNLVAGPPIAINDLCNGKERQMGRGCGRSFPGKHSFRGHRIKTRSAKNIISYISRSPIPARTQAKVIPRPTQSLRRA
jgi:hypothetical protein